MFFKDVIGQSAVKQHLLQSVQQGKLPHALLITGPAGSGKLPLALALASYVCCDHPSDTDACGTCPSCVKSAPLDGSHWRREPATADLRQGKR